MILAIIITIVALVTALIAVIAARDVITDKNKPGWKKLNKLGYVVIVSAILMVIGPMVQYFVQSHQDEIKDHNQKVETEKHDSSLRADYNKTILQMKTVYDTGNNQTLTVIGQTLAKYGYRLDTTEKRLAKLLRDSANIKTVLPNKPVLQVLSDQINQGIKFLRLDNGQNIYSINFVSEDGSSCCYNLKISAVTKDAADIYTYIGPIRVHLSDRDMLANNEAQNWNFTIDNSKPYDILYIWVRGTYGDRIGNKPTKIDQVYFNRKSSNNFGNMGSETHDLISEIVHKYEK